MDECGDIITYGYRPDEEDHGWQLYTEPKAKVVWVEYLAISRSDSVQTAGVYFFRASEEPDHSLWRYKKPAGPWR